MIDKKIIKNILQQVDITNSLFNINENNFKDFSKDIADNLAHVLKGTQDTEGVKWCLSTIKKAKVFVTIYLANENGKEIYKEEIAKKIPEYSYKTIASIVDEGLAKGYYISSDLDQKKIKDGKIKNIRPSDELISNFMKWNIERVVLAANLIRKYKK